MLIKVSLIFSLMVGAFHFLWAQENKDRIPAPEELAFMIDSIARITETYYISEEIGRQIGTYVQEQYKKGVYENMSLEALSKQMTQDLRHINGDRHLSAFLWKQRTTPKQNILSYKLDKWGEWSNYGYIETKLLKSNVGFLKIEHFTQWRYFNQAKIFASRAISMLEHTDAVIIDVRDNPGGFEDIVAYVVSHFLAQEDMHLQEYYCRHEDRGRSIRTSRELPAKRLPEIPLYVLVNEGTGSAAESLAYILKHLERATIVGDTTVGAGNGSTYYRVKGEFTIQVSTWETFNAVTNKSWETVGVIPDITTSSEAAFDKAYELAKVAAEAHRTQLNDSYKQLLSEMDAACEAHQTEDSDERVISSLSACQAAGLLFEGDINRLGYQYLGDKNKTHLAEAIFKANTLLYKHSPNVYDSYGEALGVNGKFQASIENYQKAVDLAIQQDHPDLALYKNGLEKARKKLE